jgi:broad specificity phosphatase PhoE
LGCEFFNFLSGGILAKKLIDIKCYWSLLNGNETMTWDDARLTGVGKNQAKVANGAWAKQIKNKVPFPESFYVSPLNRCLQTAYITFDGLDKDIVKPFRPVVKEVQSSLLSYS